jgi:hypothetical protein
MRMRVVTVVVTSIIVASIASPVLADTATEARIRFERGEELADRGKWRLAIDEFMVASRLAPAPGLSFNIAYCLQEMKEYAAAYNYWAETLAWGDGLEAKNRKAAEKFRAALTPRVAQLAVTSSPPGADIYIDHVKYGRYGLTPQTVASIPGKRKVILRRSGYHPAETEVELKKGELVTAAVTLKPMMGRVVVAGSPAAMEIRIDNMKGPVMARAGEDFALSVGDHILHMSAEGHLSAMHTVSVRMGEVTRVDKMLGEIPLPSGKLRILTNVPGARVEVDGVEFGFTPVVVTVPSGERVIRVTKPGYRAFSETMPIPTGEALAGEVIMEPTRQATGRGPWPWVMLSTTVVSATVTTVLSLGALDASRRYRADPSLQLYDEVNTYNNGADISLGFAVASAAGTILLFLFSEDRVEQESRGTFEVRPSVLAPR